MRNFSNPVSDLSFDEAVNAGLAERKNVSRFVFEVEGTGHHKGERKVLSPAHDTVGFLPYSGEIIGCSALGLESEWAVVRSAEIYMDKIEKESHSGK